MKTIIFVLVSLAGMALVMPLAGHASEVPRAPTPAGGADAVAGIFRLQCAPFYLPARSIWQRTVDIELDAEGVRAVKIDGVAVYTFNVNGTSILTAVDGERIQVDIAALTWSSDLRGIVSSRGNCTR